MSSTMFLRNLQASSIQNPAPEREKREHTRIHFDCPVRWNMGQRMHFGWARDVSESGASFTTKQFTAPRIGEKIKLVFELDTVCEWLVDDDAEVIRSEQVSSDLCCIGVRLRELDKQ